MSPTLTEDEHKALAKEYIEAIDATQKIAKLPNDDRIQVVRHILDFEIGTDPSADLKSLPGMTPEITEMVTDPLLELFARIITNKLFPSV